MGVEKKKSEHVKNSKSTPFKKSDMDLDHIDLGDADGSSSNSGMDNFETKAEKEKLPSEKGRIEEL